MGFVPFLPNSHLLQQKLYMLVRRVTIAMVNMDPTEWTPVIRKVQPVGRRDEPRKNGIITLLPEFVERHDLIKNKKINSDEGIIYQAEGGNVIIYTNASRDLLYILPEDSPHLPSFNKEWVADEVIVDICDFFGEKQGNLLIEDPKFCWRTLIEFLTAILVSGAGTVILQKNGGNDRLDISLMEELDSFEKEIHAKVTEDGKKIIFKQNKLLIDHNTFAIRLDEMIQIVIRLFDLFLNYLDEANHVDDPLAKRTEYEMLKRDVHRKEYEVDQTYHECVAIAKLTMYKSMLNPAFIHNLDIRSTEVMGFRVIVENLMSFTDEIQSYMYILDAYQEILPTLVAPDKLKILTKHLNDINRNYNILLDTTIGNNECKDILFEMARKEAAAIVELQVGRLKLYEKITKGSEDVLITLFADLFLRIISIRRIINNMIVRRMI
jgi:hypothetical protein